MVDIHVNYMKTGVMSRLTAVDHHAHYLTRSVAPGRYAELGSTPDGENISQDLLTPSLG